MPYLRKDHAEPPAAASGNWAPKNPGIACFKVYYYLDDAGLTRNGFARMTSSGSTVYQRPGRHWCTKDPKTSAPTVGIRGWGYIADQPERSYQLGLQLTPPRTSDTAFEVRGCQRRRWKRRLMPLQRTTDQGWTGPPGTPGRKLSGHSAIGWNFQYRALITEVLSGDYIAEDHSEGRLEVEYALNRSCKNDQTSTSNAHSTWHRSSEVNGALSLGDSTCKGGNSVIKRKGRQYQEGALVSGLCGLRETMFELDEPLTRDEFEQAVNKLKAGKASGLNGVPPEAFKAMDEELRTLVFGYCVRYWEGEDFRGWQMSRCVPVPKSGDLSNHKWRGVMLMDVISSKSTGTDSSSEAHPRLVGCADRLFTIKTLLNMRRNHNQDTYVAFVDLVKAFDTADHQLLIKILEKYGGAPFNLCKIIERMYTNLTVVLKIGKKSLEKIWEPKGLEKVQVVRASDEDFENGIGIVRGHIPKQFESSKLDILSVFQCLYVDDGAFPRMRSIYDHFACFGLEMHIGRMVNGKETAFKTEC
ncbi:hypothetical protein THAOC_11426, partial [Thalassiosira oceanica]